MKTKIYIVASTNIESTKAFTNRLLAQDYRDELQESERRDKVTIIEQEIEIPVFAVTYTSYAREDWDETLHTEAPGLFATRDEAMKAYGIEKGYARATAANEYEDSDYCQHVTPEEDEDTINPDHLEYTATRQEGCHPESCYIGRVQMHKITE